VLSLNSFNFGHHWYQISSLLLGVPWTDGGDGQEIGDGNKLYANWESDYVAPIQCLCNLRYGVESLVLLLSLSHLVLANSPNTFDDRHHRQTMARLNTPSMLRGAAKSDTRSWRILFLIVESGLAYCVSVVRTRSIEPSEAISSAIRFSFSCFRFSDFHLKSH
jgi:hypothetical protein